MSRRYRMDVEIIDFEWDKRWDIEDACQKEWSFDDDNITPQRTGRTHQWQETILRMTGESNLCGGESEEEFVHRLTRSIWKANRGYCKVEVFAIYLEDLPTNFYSCGEAEFKQQFPDGVPTEEKQEEDN